MEKLRILVVDENRNNINEFWKKIQNAFPESSLLKAFNAQTGFQIAERKDLDIIFVNYNMEEQTNFELCRQLKVRSDLADIPVVFLVETRGDMEQRTLAMQCGGDGFISQSIDEDSLFFQVLSMKKLKNGNIQKHIEFNKLNTLNKKQRLLLKTYQDQTIQLYKSLEKEYEVRRKSEKALLEAQKIAHLGNYEFSNTLEAISLSNETLKILGIDSLQDVSCIEKLSRFIHPEDRSKVIESIEKIKNEKIMVDFVCRIITKDSDVRIVNARMSPQFDKNKDHIGNFGIIQDITLSKKNEDEIRHVSYHDHLTGLYNRRYFDENLKNFDREENYPLSLVIADINGLKMINDSFGHNTGDELLKKTTAIIQNGCRGDNLIARLGGDEFAMVLPGIDETTAAQIIKQMEVFAEKEKIKGIKLSISFGCRVKTSRHQCINELIKQAEDDMYRNKLYESSSRRSKTVELIMNALYEKSSREMQHSIRVGLICEKIGLEMNMKKDEISRIRTAGMIHDIGKIGIDEKILNKPGKLNDDEWKEIRRHPEIGYRILNSVNEFSEMANCVLEHHERWDGTGYPKGVKGKNISLQARIVAVADSFDAMSSERTYRKGLNTKEILEEFRKNAGIQFDPEVTKILIENVMSKKIENKL